MHDCSHPMLPDEEELLRFVLEDEPLSPETVEHVKLCSLCQDHFSKYIHIYTNLHAFLLKHFYRSTCPSPTSLNEFCASLLPPEEAIAIQLHAAICPLCSKEIAEIQQLLMDFEPFPEEDARTFSLPLLEQIPALPVSEEWRVVRDGNVS